ncbi:hypothetical protein LPJ72_000433 [Coemansia sp. Benny D160-2]|nr:hypothetical protein LPJ72_000433 [Coemansia sp. Benny D160-2]
MNSFSESSADMPPADWCITTLHTLSNKYERITDSRKVNHPFAEAVLNSFKSKLLNAVSLQSFYDSEGASDDDAEWNSLSGDASYDPTDNSNNNYISIPSSASPVDVSDVSSLYQTKSAEETEVAIAGCIPTPSPSPTDIDCGEPYLATTSNCVASQSPSFDASVSSIGCDISSELVTLPPNIEEALRRILANANGQVLGDTFTTFANASETELLDTASAANIVCQQRDDDDDEDDNSAEEEEEEEEDDSRFVSDSGNCSPDSLDSPEGTIDYMASDDSVDIFVKSFTTNGGWEVVERPGKGSSASSSTRDSNCLTPCKRKRSSEAEDLFSGEVAQAKNAIPRNKAIISPRKRSRSINHNDAAAVPISESRKKSAGVTTLNTAGSSNSANHSSSTTPPVSPLLAMAITAGPDNSSASD